MHTLNERVLADMFTYLIENKLIGLIKQIHQHQYSFHLKNKKNQYPILQLCSNGEVDYVKILFDIGIDFALKDDEGSNAAYYALRNGNQEVLNFLIGREIYPISSIRVIYQDMKKIIDDNDVEKMRLFLYSNIDDVKNYVDYDKSNLGSYCLK